MKTDQSSAPASQSLRIAPVVRVLSSKNAGQSVQSETVLATSPVAGPEWGGCSCWLHN